MPHSGGGRPNHEPQDDSDSACRARSSHTSTRVCVPLKAHRAGHHGHVAPGPRGECREPQGGGKGSRTDAHEHLPRAPLTPPPFPLRSRARSPSCAATLRTARPTPTCASSLSASARCATSTRPRTSTRSAPRASLSSSTSTSATRRTRARRLMAPCWTGGAFSLVGRGRGVGRLS